MTRNSFFDFDLAAPMARSRPAGAVMQAIAFDGPPTALTREWLALSQRRMRRNSAWSHSRNHGGDGPSIHRLVWPLIGHLISSFLVFVTLFVLT
jgi:hypothetical protein